MKKTIIIGLAVVGLAVAGCGGGNGDGGQQPAGTGGGEELTPEQLAAVDLADTLVLDPTLMDGLCGVFRPYDAGYLTADEVKQSLSSGFREYVVGNYGADEETARVALHLIWAASYQYC